MEGKNTIVATWTEGDVVKVYDGSTKLGTLRAKNVSADGTSCALWGTEISQPLGSEITLKYQSPSYTNQNGTLTGNEGSIDRICDYATASVTVAGISGGYDSHGGICVYGTVNFDSGTTYNSGERVSRCRDHGKRIVDVCSHSGYSASTCPYCVH